MAYVLRLPVALKELSPLLGSMESMMKFQELMKAAGLVKKVDKRFSAALAKIPEQAIKYACEDSVATARDYLILKERLEAEPKLNHYYHTFEKPLVPILYHMEKAGIMIDPDQLNRAGGGLLEEAAAIREELGFNPNSHDQVAKFFTQFGIHLKINAKDKEEVDKGALEEIARTHPPLVEAVSMILKYRQNTKLKATYVDAILDRLDDNSRVHARFNQCVTATDRLSSSEPNMQNLPARTGDSIRRAVIARPGHVLLKADGSQLEVRGFASVTQDPTLVAAVRSGKDIHGEITNALGLPKSKRVIAKTAVFAFIYGAELDKLDEILRVNAGIHMSKVELEDFAKRLHTYLPGVANWQKQVACWLDTQGYVETIFGWRNYYPMWFSSILTERNKALREAANLPVQGLAAGWAKRLMIEERGLLDYYDTTLVLQVHDEVVLETPISAVRELAPKMVMLGAEVGLPEITVPIVLDVKVGENWVVNTEWEKYEAA